MNKSLRKIFMTVTTILFMSLFFATCSEDPASSKQDGPVGIWKLEKITFITNSDTSSTYSYADNMNESIFLEINDDGTCMNIISRGQNSHTDTGTWKTNDNQIAFIFKEDGFEMYEYILSEDKLVLIQSVQQGEDFLQAVQEFTRQ